MSNSNCIEQSCYQGCCNLYGYCPNTYSFSSYQNSCYYYYNYGSTYYYSSLYYIIPSVVCSILFILAVSCIIYHCYKKRRYQQNAVQTVIPVTANIGSADQIYGYNNGQVQYFGNNLVYNQLNSNNFQHQQPNQPPQVPPTVYNHYAHSSQFAPNSNNLYLHPSNPNPIKK